MHHNPYIVGVDRASQDLEFGISFDLSAPLWPIQNAQQKLLATSAL
jgi:hypothetical protein